RAAQPGSGTVLVGGCRRGEPGSLQRLVDRLLVGAWPASPQAASGAGRGAAGGRRRMSEDKVSIAIPTGALLDGARAILAGSGLASIGAEELGRQLLIESELVRVIMVRPADVPAYVDHGAADLGIVGKDILWETPGSHYE